MRLTAVWFTLVIATLTAIDAQQSIKPSVPDYKLSTNLAEIRNKSLFEIKPSAQQLLAKNYFVIVPAPYEQPFYIYEENVYWDIPHFITVDSMLHIYHLFFMSALKDLEGERCIH